ncbi:helix-turn-helix transcriptional regulator [Salinarimonas sp. NSM]|uniref:helix-turn-helix transcriptional regulator n=1 Tax=Salinarimonas sp. NSM TaxID=3458003 RepID=UPI004036A3C4
MTIDDVSRGSVEPASAWEPIAAEIRGDPERGPARVYEALRDLVWRLVRGNRPVDELIRWQDLCARTAAGIRAKRPALADRIDGLVDVLLTSVHFHETASASTTLDRAHVSEALAIVRAAGGAIQRDDLRQRLGLKQPNLTRVLEVMEAAGLIRREMRGRVCVVTLPEAEMAAAARKRELAKDRAPAERPGHGAPTDKDALGDLGGIIEQVLERLRERGEAPRIVVIEHAALSETGDAAPLVIVTRPPRRQIAGGEAQRAGSGARRTEDVKHVLDDVQATLETAHLRLEQADDDAEARPAVSSSTGAGACISVMYG